MKAINDDFEDIIAGGAGDRLCAMLDAPGGFFADVPPDLISRLEAIAKEEQRNEDWVEVCIGRDFLCREITALVDDIEFGRVRVNNATEFCRRLLKRADPDYEDDTTACGEPSAAKREWRLQ